MKGHRVFSRWWAWAARREPRRLVPVRREVVAGVRGRVLEVGVGTGSNWPYLPVGIHYTGIEPDEYMLRQARENAADDGRDLDLQPHDVTALPFPDETFDTVFTTLTFCSVRGPEAGLAEVLRVLRPGGEFRFAEHVRAHGRLAAGLQGALRPLTRVLGGGCEWDRDTLAAIRRAGFENIRSRRGRMAVVPLIVGSATRPAGSEPGR